MKPKFKIVFISLIALATYTACKKEPVDSKVFVEKSLVGNWPLILQVETVLKNGKDTISPSDSLKFTVADTTTFTADLKFIRKTTSVNFAIDNLGENITFSTTPDSIWHIGYLRKSSFKLVYTRKETVGTDVLYYITERDFSK